MVCLFAINKYKFLNLEKTGYRFYFSQELSPVFYLDFITCELRRGSLIMQFHDTGDDSPRER